MCKYNICPDISSHVPYRVNHPPDMWLYKLIEVFKQLYKHIHVGNLHIYDTCRWDPDADLTHVFSCLTLDNGHGLSVFIVNGASWWDETKQEAGSEQDRERNHVNDVSSCRERDELSWSPLIKHVMDKLCTRNPSSDWQNIVQILRFLLKHPEFLADICNESLRRKWRRKILFHPDINVQDKLGVWVLAKQASTPL